MRTKSFLLACGLASGLSGAAFAQSAAGAQPLDLLFLDGTGRPAAMAGAYTALSSDANSLLYNPAGLARVRRNEAAFMHRAYFQGLNQEYLAFSFPQGWGMNLSYLNFGGIPRTTLADQTETIGSYGVNSMFLGAGYGLNLFDDLSLGVGAKYVREQIDGLAANAFAADVGALYTVPWHRALTLGLAVQNMGPPLRFAGAKEQLPLNLRGAAAYAFTMMGTENTLSADVSKERSGNTAFSIGAETVIKGAFAIRGGIATRNKTDVGATLGVGWTFRGFSIDYALAPYGDLGLTNSISATLRWGGVPKAPEEDWKRLEPASPEPKGTPHAPADRRPAEPLFESQRQVQDLEQEGLVAFLSNDIPKAKTAYSEAIRMANRMGSKGEIVAAAYLGLGRCFLEEGNPSYAAKSFNKVLLSDPSPQTRQAALDQLKKLGRASGD